MYISSKFSFTDYIIKFITYQTIQFSKVMNSIKENKGKHLKQTFGINVYI